jgi:hypothetical protein
LHESFWEQVTVLHTNHEKYWAERPTLYILEVTYT